MGNKEKFDECAAIEKLRAEFISQSELQAFLGLTDKRMKDLISLHKNDGKFMPAYRAAAGVYYFRYDDVRTYLLSRSSV